MTMIKTPNSWHVRIFGIEVHVHWTFLLLLGWFFAAHMVAGHGVARALRGVVFTAMVFAGVVLHELGHALMARRFGIQTRNITLYPIGGVAQLERLPERPREELLVAIIGPLVSFAIAGILLLFVPLPAPKDVSDMTGNFWGSIAYVNLTLGLFNLLPAFPMDGGRVLHAILAWRMDPLRATTVAAQIGKSLALLMGVIGLIFAQTMLVFIACFVFISAEREALVMRTRSLLRGITVRDAMVGSFEWIDAFESVGDAAQSLRDSDQEAFPVLNEGKLTGVITRDALLRALEDGHDARSVRAMSTPSDPVPDTMPLNDALTRLQSSAAKCLPVTRDGQLTGLLTGEHLGKWLSLHEAIAGRDHTVRSPLTGHQT